MRQRCRWLLDLAALAILGLFGWNIALTARGAADPIWSAIQQRGTLRVGTAPGFRPFVVERDGRLQGYDIDLVNEVVRRLGLRAEFVPLAYDALYDTLSTRQVELLTAALPLAPEQGWRARFSTPYLNAGLVLVLHRAGTIDADAPQLSGRTIGVALGSDADSYARALQQRDARISVRNDFETPEAALAALTRRQVDAVIADAVSALAAGQADPELMIAPNALTFEPYVLAMPVEAYQLHGAINQALEAMRLQGWFDQANQRWFRPEHVYAAPDGS
ncbi:ABC transporter substrate-binding protein [Kallotenue papyrolyticum]|uniref:ABC transporter substrate-binding protein n=1 Tax=Kallotenue papyrolyticum TaxID=1325125 RepID=UPI0004929C01|nr:ABC transporter substrate-binding protein [Kallotenue papyrolyticum]